MLPMVMLFVKGNSMAEIQSPLSLDNEISIRYQRAQTLMQGVHGIENLVLNAVLSPLDRLQ